MSYYIRKELVWQYTMLEKGYKEARFEHISSVNNFIVFVNTPKTSKRTIESLGSFSASNFVHYFYARLS